VSAEQEDQRVGTVLLDKLEVLRRIGGGGMGAVYEVKHRLTGHHRALKIVREKYARQPRFMKRLLREARVAAELRTPYVVETIDAGRLEDGSAYVLMELLEGRALLSLIRSRGELDVPTVAWVVGQICEGLAVAHEADIIHRDLKPENIFVTRDPDGNEQVKILDFGVSKFPEGMDEVPTRLTREGTILGTPFYMSPEQAAGRVLDPRTDLYSLGVLMYEALTGHLPFEDRSVGGLFLKIGAGEYLPLSHHRPDVDSAFVEIVQRAFHKDPAERFQTALALRDAVAPFVHGRPGVELRSTLDYSEDPPPSRPAPPRSEPPNLDTQGSQPPRRLTGSDPPETRGRPAWPTLLLVLAAAVVLGALVIPLLGSEEQANGGPATVSRPPPSEVIEARVREPAQPLAPEPEAPAALPDAEQQVAAPAEVEPTPSGEQGSGSVQAGSDATMRPIRRRGSRPSERAGLDDNPY
jgi:serine/threonine-protein kinase